MIGVIVIVYGHYPHKLFDSIASSNHKIRWYIFFHGHDGTIERRLAQFAAQSNGVFFPYRRNRGLATSWNEGMALSVRELNSFHLLLNDDGSF